jgi:CubicO group peptidase (beta-lactamase class C family)
MTLLINYLEEKIYIMNRMVIYLKSLFFFNCLFLIACLTDPAGIENDQFYPWEISSPEKQGLNSEILSNAFTEAQHAGFVDCILIIKNGRLIAENYYNGYDMSQAHNVKSVSKSFLSALTGIALREGYLNNLNHKMLGFFPEYEEFKTDDRMDDITIRHLLMMRAGLDDERNNYSYFYNSPDWIKATIEYPLLYDPGSTFCYNTFQTHLLSAILTKTSGLSTLKLAEQFLFEPLNISVHQWQQDPQGYYFGGNNMYFRPRDMAMLGYLYLNDGNINGKQIVPAEWVEQSLINYTGFVNYNWDELKNVNYGYLWWLGEINNYKVFMAIGYGGQFVFCFPGLDMIVVSTADTAISWETSDFQIVSIINIVSHHILPAILP